MLFLFFFFFFQAEDGIRDLYVTGVQTCALPISPAKLYDLAKEEISPKFEQGRSVAAVKITGGSRREIRSEERRVGKSVDLGGRRIIKKKKKKKKIERK